MQVFAPINVWNNGPFSCCKFNQPLIREAPGPDFARFCRGGSRTPWRGQKGPVLGVPGPLKWACFGPGPVPSQARPGPKRACFGGPGTPKRPVFGPGPGPAQARPGGSRDPQARAADGTGPLRGGPMARMEDWRDDRLVFFRQTGMRRQNGPRRSRRETSLHGYRSLLATWIIVKNFQRKFNNIK